MKTSLSIVLMLVVMSVAYAAGDCNSTAGNTTEQSKCDKVESVVSGLPEDALAEVKELDVKMRFFMSIGMQKRSRERRDAIMAIYEKHGVEVPDKYQNWK